MKEVKMFKLDNKSALVTGSSAGIGKAIANGYPLTAVIGRDKIMRKASESFISSTFWTDRIGYVAAIKTLDIMEQKKSWKTRKQPTHFYWVENGSTIKSSKNRPTSVEIDRKVNRKINRKSNENRPNAARTLLKSLDKQENNTFLSFVIVCL